MLGNRKAARHTNVNAISTDARPSCNRFQTWQSALSSARPCARCTRCKIWLTPYTGVQGVTSLRSGGLHSHHFTRVQGVTSVRFFLLHPTRVQGVTGVRFGSHPTQVSEV